MALAASRWPASVRRCTSVSPERSLPASRLSETVRTAMFTGMKGRDGSIPGILHHRARIGIGRFVARPVAGRSEEHTSELQSLMRISYAVFCLKKKKQHIQKMN